MGEFADDLINAEFDEAYSRLNGETLDDTGFGIYRANKCTNSDIRHIVENAIARKAQKPISREILDKHVAEIAKIRFNPNVEPVDIERSIDDLLDKSASYRTRHDPNIYRQIALCAILLAYAAESGKW
jgi:hypothetical protein